MSGKTQKGFALAPRYQHVGIPIAKFWRWGHCPTPTPNARYFVSQWNIGLSLLPTGSEERGVLGVGYILLAILLSYQDVRNIASQLHKHVLLCSRNEKHLRGSTQATISLLDIILTPIFYQAFPLFCIAR